MAEEEGEDAVNDVGGEKVGNQHHQQLATELKIWTCGVCDVCVCVCVCVCMCVCVCVCVCVM